MSSDRDVKSEGHEEIVWAADPVTEVRIGHCLPEVQGQKIEEAVDLLSLPTL